MAQMKQKQEVIKLMFVVVLIVLTTNIPAIAFIFPGIPDIPKIPEIPEIPRIPETPVVPAACKQLIGDVVQFSEDIVGGLSNNPLTAADDISNFVNDGRVALRNKCGLPGTILSSVDPIAVDCLRRADETFQFLAKTPQRLRDNAVQGAQEGIQFLNNQNMHFRDDCSKIVTLP